MPASGGGRRPAPSSVIMERMHQNSDDGRTAPIQTARRLRSRRAAPPLAAACHCGRVEIRIPRRPATLTNCDCSICRRYGCLWAYFRRGEVLVLAEDGATRSYAWGPKTIRFVRCASCGCVTHWEPAVAGRGERMGVNARLFAPAELGAPRIRLLDGAVSERYLS